MRHEATGIKQPRSLLYDRRVDPVPATSDEVIRALGLPADASVEPASGGASGDAWRVHAAGESYVIRAATSSASVDARLAAMAAARTAGFPVPDLLARARVGDRDLVLLSWLPGTSLLETLNGMPSDAPRLGRLMGEMQRRLHTIRAPEQLPGTDAGFPFAAGGDDPRMPRGEMLLHLDWHPLNLLVDRGSVAISGIVDWDNARRGHPLLDLARTHSILTLEPGLATLPTHVRAVLPAFLDGWAAGYGPEAGSIPAACHLWAARVMLADLMPRYADDPAALGPIRRRIERLGGER